MKRDYASAGVHIDSANELICWLKERQSSSQPLKSTKEKVTFPQKALVSGIGGFASILRLKELLKGFTSPCLVTATDGIGTKIQLAETTKDFQNLGQDLVAMCVNDLICCGAKPLLFLDYYATSKLNVSQAKAFLEGILKACEICNTFLCGGETAEMPGVYREGDFDCAGFAVGLAEEENLLGSHRVKAGQQLLALPSSGLHSNGFSLIRKLFSFDRKSGKTSLREELLTPTFLYPPVLAQIQSYLHKDAIGACAHITGEGMYNVLRILPSGHHWKMKSWPWPSLFREVQKRSGLSKKEMLTTFNCGIGLVLVLKEEEVLKVTKFLEKEGQAFHLVGEVVQDKTKKEPEIFWEG